VREGAAAPAADIGDHGRRLGLEQRAHAFGVQLERVRPHLGQVALEPDRDPLVRSDELVQSVLHGPFRRVAMAAHSSVGSSFRHLREDSQDEL
jgi:hypothetical protein